jgi:hypothetical protein
LSPERISLSILRFTFALWERAGGRPGFNVLPLLEKVTSQLTRLGWARHGGCLG